MESRCSERIILNLPAEVIMAGKHYAGSIENLSPAGIYLVTAPTGNSADFTPEALLTLKFTLPSGEGVDLNCKIKWSYLTPPHGFTNSIGLEIINPPASYSTSLRSLK